MKNKNTEEFFSYFIQKTVIVRFHQILWEGSSYLWCEARGEREKKVEEKRRKRKNDDVCAVDDDDHENDDNSVL